MNEINLVEILKDAPKDTEVYSPIFGYGLISDVHNNQQCQNIHVIQKWNQANFWVFDKFGHLANRMNCEDGECLLFPSKDNRDWSTFKAPWKHKRFQPFQKVLVLSFEDHIWVPSLYSYYDKKEKVHVLIDNSLRDDDEIIPYKGNENKLGKPVNE